jgi:hypothetical protein
MVGERAPASGGLGMIVGVLVLPAPRATNETVLVHVIATVL